MYFIKVKVKSRKQKKRILYRITYLEEEEYEKRGLISFGKNTNSIAKNSQPFISILAQELASLASNKMHPVRILRDNLHKIAFKFAPRRWFYATKNKKKYVKKVARNINFGVKKNMQFKDKNISSKIKVNESLNTKKNIKIIKSFSIL